MPFQILHNDITNMDTDAIVNAANSKLQIGGGVCGAIFRAAGEEELQKECEQIKHCPVGHAVITKGYNLKAKYIIHTVGPIYKDGNSNEAKLLKSAYETSLKLAKDYNLTSIAFPLIYSGIYGYPKKEALNIAVSTIKEFLADNDMDINGLVGTVISILVYNNLIGWLNLLNTLIPAIGAIMQADYFIINKRKYVDFKEAKFEYINVNAILGWFAGVAGAYIIPGIIPLNSVGVAVITYVILTQLKKKKEIKTVEMIA